VHGNSQLAQVVLRPLTDITAEASWIGGGKETAVRKMLKNVIIQKISSRTVKCEATNTPF